jgi:hypothetical protein
VEFCARCQGAPGGERREVIEVRGVNGLVNGHGINGHGLNGRGHDSDSEEEDEDEDKDEDVESISSDLERELQDFVPESYRRALAGENDTTASSSGSTPRHGQGSNIPAASTSNIHPTQTNINTNPTGTSSTTSTTPTHTTNIDANEARRQQSDRASNLIGTLLLQGYALLSGLCDNEGCYGIPLVGHPRRQASSAGRTTDTSGGGGSARNAGAGRAAGSASGSGTGGQKKECVICGKVWEADGTVSRESRGSAGQQPVGERAARGAGAGPVPESFARAAVGSGVGPGSGSGSGSRQAQVRPNSISSMLIPQAMRMRDISREEAMRIYSGEVDVSTALRDATGSAEGETSIRGTGAGTAMDDLAAMAPAACWAAEEVVDPDSSSPAAGRPGEDDPTPLFLTASGRGDFRQPHGNATTTTTVINPSGQLDIATTLNSTEQALLSTLEAINRTYLLKSSGSPAEFERFISEGEVRKYVEASAEVMRGLQGVERMRGRMGLESQTQTRTRQRERGRQREWDREREERRNYAWRNRDRDLERDLDRESYRERSISPYVNEFGGRRYYE